MAKDSVNVNNKYNTETTKKNSNNFALVGIPVLIIIMFIIILTRILKINILEFFKNLFLLKYLPKLGNNTSYVLLFVFGILTSFHCIGMCGGIAISQSIKRDKTKLKNGKSYIAFIPSLLYNTGRVISYTIVGCIVGGLGHIISFSSVLSGIVPIVGGIFMIIMAINLLGIFRVLRRLNITVPTFIAKKIYKKNSYGPVIVGLLNGLMPCGPLQIVQLYALGTKSVLIGAASMFIFSIGTVPILFVFGVINTIINRKFSTIISKISAVLVLTLGVVMIGRGLSLYGVSIGVKSMVSESGQGYSTFQRNTQVVKTEAGSDSFPSIEVVKGVPVKWNLHVEEKNFNECNKALQIPKYKIKKNLAVGDNIIEFTPDEDGRFIYTCWMGMIKSKIIVVDNMEKLKQDQIKDSR